MSGEAGMSVNPEFAEKVQKADREVIEGPPGDGYTHAGYRGGKSTSVSAKRKKPTKAEKPPEAVAPVPRSLAAKLAYVMSQMSRLPKTGYNAHHGYPFATDADVSDTVRGLLAEQHVAFMPSIESVQRETVGKAGYNHSLKWEMRFYDGGSGESITTSWCSEANDTQDKGINKAATAGVKYFLLKTFLISTGDEVKNIKEDPDYAQDGNRISDEEKIKRMETAVKASGKKWESFTGYVEKQEGKPALEAFRDPKRVNWWYHYIQTELNPSRRGGV